MARKVVDPNTVIVKPTSNVYTTLTVVALVVEIVGFVALLKYAEKLIPPGLGLM